MGKLITIWEFIGRHKYWITVVAFGVIIGFLDENSMIRRIGYAREISRLQGEIDKYRAEYEENTERLNELSTNPEAIEQIALEKYLMKSPTKTFTYLTRKNETTDTRTFRRRRSNGPHRGRCLYHRMGLCTLYIYHRGRFCRIGSGEYSASG